jgi:hypothetical protein
MIAETEHRATWFVAACDICQRPYDAEPYDNRPDLEHDLRVEGWHLNDLDTTEIVCPVCWPGREDDADRPARGLPALDLDDRPDYTDGFRRYE